MWSIAEPAFPPWSAEALQPSEVLYEFDGPLTFTAKFGFFDAFFIRSGSGEASSFS